jgi:hypothetical protein
MNGVWRGQQEKPNEGKKKRKKATTKMGGKGNRNHRGPLKRERKETREEKAGGERAKINSLKSLITAPKAPMV